MAVVVSIDAGTTGVRSLAIDELGAIRSWHYQEFTQHFPQPGWVEHDASEIWNAVVSTLSKLVDELTEPIAAIGITDQRETIVAWDRRTGEPLGRAIVWQDRRGAGRCEELEAAGHLGLIRSTTGLVLDPYFSATKIEWMHRHGGVAVDDNTAFGTIDSWILWNLTGGRADAGAVHATDASNASRTMLFDIAKGDWSSELCELFDVPVASLPDVLPSAGRFGVTSADMPTGAGIPISGIAGDQQSALFGQACVRPGMTKNTYGTGSFVLMNIGDTLPAPADGLLTTVAWTLPGRLLGDASGGDVTHYALEGAIFVTGAAIQWLRDGIEIIENVAETGPLAESVPDTGGVMVVPTFTGLGAPYWDPYARGTIVGLTRGTTRAHLVRAVVESMAYRTRDVVDAMAAIAGRAISELRVDGGASQMNLLMQLVADQLGVEVVRPTVKETTALGAAYLAGLAEGVWATVDDLDSAWQEDYRTTPTAPHDEIEERYRMWTRAVERARHWAED